MEICLNPHIVMKLFIPYDLCALHSKYFTGWKNKRCIYCLEFPVSYKYYPGQIELSLIACVTDINNKLTSKIRTLSSTIPNNC